MEQTIEQLRTEGVSMSVVRHDHGFFVFWHVAVHPWTATGAGYAEAAYGVEREARYARRLLEFPHW